MSFQKKGKKQQPTHTVEEATPPEECTLYPVIQQKSSFLPLRSTLEVDGKELTMEVDTGAALSIISEATYKKLWESDTPPELQQTSVRLHTYTGEEMSVLGCIDINWQEIGSIRANQSLESLLEQHKRVFNVELGTLKDVKAKLHVDLEAKSLFYKARTVPFALRRKVEDELERLEKEDIITPVKFSDWAVPIVPVEKRDGSVRVCGDYKLTVNRVAKTEVYSIPKIKEMFASLAGGKKFSKLDLSHAYQQIQLEEESQKYVTVNTHKGLFQYEILPCGVASAPATADPL